MKKKLLALIMVLSLIFAMTAIGCSSSSDADSSSDASSTSSTETESEAPEDTEDVSSEEEAVEEETADTFEEETPEDETSSSDVSSDEELQGVCDSIRESIIDNYLTPNNLSTEDFSWSSDEMAWDYLTAIMFRYGSTVYDEGDLSDWRENEISSADSQIMRAVYTGIVDWIEINTDGSTSEFLHIAFGVLAPIETTLPANVTFE